MTDVVRLEVQGDIALITSEGQYFTHLHLIPQVYNGSRNRFDIGYRQFNDRFRLRNIL